MANFAIKRSLVSGLIMKIETTYGTAVVPAVTDAEELYYTDRNSRPRLVESYLYDGKIGPAAGSLGDLRNIEPAARICTWEPQFLFRPPNANYSASVFSSRHLLLKTAGFTAAFAANKWVYTPTVDLTAKSSATGYAYGGGEETQFAGALNGLSIEWTNEGPVLFKFPMKGIWAARADVALPSLTYPFHSNAPLIGAGAALSINSVTTLPMYSGSFMMNRDLETVRRALAALLGWEPGGRSPELKVTVEKVALATFDPHTLFAARTEFAASVVFGSVTNQGRHMKINCPQCTLGAPPVEGNNGAVETWELTVNPHLSPVANDDFTIETETTGA